MQAKTPAPSITPGSHGGVMVEWHENGIDLEIEMERPGRLWVSFEDERDLIEEERELTSNLEALTEPITKLTERAEAQG